MVWNESDGGVDYRLRFAHSTGTGETWTAPRSVDARTAQHANAFRPFVVRRWCELLDTRESPRGRTYREFLQPLSLSRAYFDYSSAFQDLPCLAPRQITEAVPWDAQPLALERTFVTVHFKLLHSKPR